MESLASALRAYERALTAVFKFVAIVLFAAIAFIVTANVFVRYVPVTSLHWLDEIVELSFAAMVFYGAAAVWMAKGHFSAGDWISGLLGSAGAKRAYRALVEIVSLIFIAVFFYYSLSLTQRAREATAVFQIPKAVLYSCMPISTLTMILWSIGNLVLLVGGRNRAEAGKAAK